ncbi:periplasmic chaperone for outer membrane proteins Skp [Mucilaginibacter yixingensis]|uniref:Periplasmic chaperone for outer membrane proteins Skp n=1 Tax=Mucilaginibacter yixingensis TaxID=1295612 RepID=A0A2T5JCB1_9SPHI|nr:OmpH family outer membrane protein [Mucilaginibacter yixingensis]PTQ99305.1 periplasmic chaperone for outer membrane proteins Skp [Mucilaginibacter yixingensis]
MKNSVSLVTNIALGLVIAGGLAACKNGGDTKTATTTASSAAPAKADIVFINEDSVSSKVKYAVDMRKRVEDKSKSAQSDVASRQQAFQREYAEAQKSAASMTPDQQKAAGERLQRDGQAFQQYQQNAGAELQTLQNDEMKKLYDKVTEFTKTYAKDHGYKLVLTYQTGNTTVLYGDPSLDVTADFVKAFNEAYDKDTKK